MTQPTVEEWTDGSDVVAVEAADAPVSGRPSEQVLNVLNQIFDAIEAELRGDARAAH